MVTIEMIKKANRRMKEGKANHIVSRTKNEFTAEYNTSLGVKRVSFSTDKLKEAGEKAILMVYHRSIKK